MSSGYTIKEIRVSGEGVPDSKIIFERGLNVLTGPSDTGKTYVFECINYMLGGSRPPKKVKESRNYSTIWLELYSNNGDSFSLKSDLKGGDILQYDSRIDDITFDESYNVLSRKHNPNSEETISAFLQKINNVYGTEIRTNARGQKRQLSYRDLVRFFLIDEERIITKDSLVISHYTKATEEKNVLKFIVTGEDDSDIIALVSKDKISNRKGRLEYIIETIERLRKEIGGSALDSIQSEVAKLDSQILQLRTTYSQISREIEIQRGERNSITRKIDKSERRKRELEELYFRSSFLERQYELDIERLKSTTEASMLLLDSGHEASKCPVCKGSMPEECSDSDIEKIISSCSAEVQKITTLIEELKQSVLLIKNEIDQLEDELSILDSELNEFDSKVNNGLGEQLNSILDLIDETNSKKNILLELQLKKDNIDKLVVQKESLEKTISEARIKSDYESVSTASLSDLSSQIESVLKGCNYPDLAAVSFSEDKADFVISGEDRELFGKGFRAIIYAAFVVALQELLNNKTYSIGVPVIDSPLVTYKKPEYENDDLIPVDLAMDFYRYINKSTAGQIIIIENVEPPEDIIGDINHIRFTRSQDYGRYGFFPS